MNFDVDALRQQIPFYLTDASQHELLANLKALSSGEHPDIYLSDYRDDLGDDLLQGDGMRGFEIFNWNDKTIMSIRGIVLSNSCDVSTSNVRDVPSRVVFAPLVKLRSFELLLQKSGVAEDKIASKIAAIRQQKTTNIFYLPSGGPLADDYIVRLDEVQSLSLGQYSQNGPQERLFRLNMSGFYLLCLKLSLHFCRLQEGIIR